MRRVSSYSTVQPPQTVNKQEAAELVTELKNEVIADSVLNSAAVRRDSDVGTINSISSKRTYKRPLVMRQPSLQSYQSQLPKKMVTPAPTGPLEDVKQAVLDLASLGPGFYHYLADKRSPKHAPTNATEMQAMGQ